MEPKGCDCLWSKTARAYAALKSDVEYIRDKVASYIKAKTMILDYLKENGEITNATIQELCGFTKQQARSAIDKMRDEKLIEKVGKARGSKYVLKPTAAVARVPRVPTIAVSMYWTAVAIMFSSMVGHASVMTVGSSEKARFVSVIGMS